MKNMLETPKNELPKKDESVDIDLSDLADETGKGVPEFTPEEISSRHEALGREYAEQREKEQRGFRAVAESFFAKNPFLVARFDKDPEAMQRFKQGLKSLVVTSAFVYHCSPEELPGVEGFQKDLVKFSFDFEEKERARKSGRRAA